MRLSGSRVNRYRRCMGYSPNRKTVVSIAVHRFAVLFMVFPSIILSEDRSFHYRFDYWVNNTIRYGIIDHPKLLLRLSEMPYSRADLAAIIERSENVGLVGLDRYYYERWKSKTAGNQSASDALIEIHWRNGIAYSDRLHRNEKLKLESDLIGFVNIGDGLSAYVDFQFDTDGAYDSDYHGVREWKDLTGDMRAAYVEYCTKRWSLLVGRDFIHWGPGRTGALLSSGHAPALDMIKLTFDVGNFRFTAFNALLGRANEAEGEEKINRYFSGHRLSLRLRRLELGVSETILYGGPKESISPFYFNPLIPYYLSDTMQEENRKDNVALAVDAAIYWPVGFRWYGQAVIDEYQYEGEGPNNVGLLFGFEWLDVLGWSRFRLNAEYVCISRWTYNYELTAPWNKMIYFNGILGHPIGPDADLIHVEPEVYLGSGILIRIPVNYVRGGETSVHTPYDSEQMDWTTNVPFPFGVIEKRLTTGLEMEWAPGIDWLVQLKLQYTSIMNMGHGAGENKARFGFRIFVQHDVCVKK